MPNKWNMLVLEMGVEHNVLITTSWNNVNLDNRNVGNVVLVIAFKSSDMNTWATCINKT
jgi:hypothetical protein